MRVQKPKIRSRTSKTEKTDDDKLVETFFDEKVSILVNNAGVNPGLGWKTCIDVMLLGVGFGTFQAIEKMAISKVRLF